MPLGSPTLVYRIFNPSLVTLCQCWSQILAPRHFDHEAHIRLFISCPLLGKKSLCERAVTLSLTDAQVSGSVAQLSIPTTLPNGWASQGCWTDVQGRTIGAAGYASATAMTAESCISFCETRGFAYAGVEYSSECFCGNTLAPAAAQVAASACNMPCSGDALQPCGGGGRLNLFHSAAVSGPKTNPGVNDFVHMGCYSEGTTGRTLTHGVSGAVVPEAQMTVDRCTAACASAGFSLAGVEYGSECFCGHVISNGGAPATGCNMVCNGNSSEFCGAGGRLNVYTRGALPLTVTR